MDREVVKRERDLILAFERELAKLPQAEADLHHHFAPGVYAREQRIPAGTILTGKIHKTEHLSIIAKGKIAVVWPGGKEIFSAPHVMVSKPGAKRAGYALEDTVWITVHVTEHTDLEKIENEVIAKDFDEVDRLEAL